MEKKVTVGDKEYTICEIKYKDVAGSTDLNQAEAAKVIMMSSTGMSEEEYSNLSMKDGLEIQKVINEINGLEDFQKPLIK